MSTIGYKLVEKNIQFKLLGILKSTEPQMV